MDSVVKAKASEFNELMDFLHSAFSAGSTAKVERFETLLPDLYQPTEESMSNVLLTRDPASGKIASSAGLFPMKLKLWGEPLTIQGVGGVGTSQEFRGKGMMSQVLDEINAELQRRGGPFAWLSGMRHRYDVWGYEKAGAALLLHMPAHNRKAFKPAGFEVSELSFAAMLWSEFLALRDASPASGGAAGIAELKLKFSRPSLRFFVAKKDGKPASFVCLSSDSGNISDWAGDASGAADIAFKILSEREWLQIRLPLDATSDFKAFAPLAEDVSVIMQGNFAVVNLLECLKLLCKSPAFEELPSKGRRSVGIVMAAGKNPAQAATLFVDNGVPGCSEGVEGCSTVLELSPAQCAALFFGPLKPSQLLGEDAPSWLDAVLPLPVFVPRLYWV